MKIKLFVDGTVSLLTRQDAREFVVYQPYIWCERESEWNITLHQVLWKFRFVGIW